jgi:hypothetical protein
MRGVSPSMLPNPYGRQRIVVRLVMFSMFLFAW